MYQTDDRLIAAIEELAGEDCTGDDNPEESNNLADKLWCDGFFGDLSPRETQEKLLGLLPPPRDDDDDIFWGESLWAVPDNGRWSLTVEARHDL